MKKRMIIFVFFSFLFFSPFLIFAQVEKQVGDLSIDAGVDFVSAYIWRGLAFDNSPNVQAWGLLAYKNLVVGTWGSVSFNGKYYEPDLFLTYTHKKIELAIYDVHAGFGNDFFNYNKLKTSHLIDASLGYTLSDAIPLKISGAIILYGIDKRIESYDSTGNPVLGTKDNYSGYIELNYPIKINDNTLALTLGMSTQESFVYATKGFGVINAGINFSKEIKINEKFSLPLSFAFISNPYAKKVFTVLKVSL